MTSEPKPFFGEKGGLFDELAADHAEILALAEALTGGSSAPSDDDRQRKALAEQLVIAESKHEAVEELIFWPVVRSLEGGDDLVHEGIAQEGQAKSTLEELEHVKAGNETFISLTHDALSRVRDHISYEENIVWPKLRLALGDEEVLRLGQQFRQARAVAPTRPHPHTPADPLVLGTVGTVIAMSDRARDRISGRGSGVQGVGRLRAVAGIGALCSSALAGVMMLRRHRRSLGARR